jgi:23S rRNA (cytosine1962-C5)-methyltransferase
MIIPPQSEYELIDSGDEMKLERYGTYTLARPDPQAIWPRILPQEVWNAADVAFVRGTRDTRDGTTSGDGDDKGKWIKKHRDIPDQWSMTLGGIRLFTRLTPFKHTAIFPEQFDNWQWSEQLIKKSKQTTGVAPKVLNLFGYTGGASIVCTKAGAQVTHVDASRAAITWAKENMIETGLSEDSIRWILEDAVVFVKKEIKRGNRYDAIMMDPPVFGRGAKGEVWKIERDLGPLLELCYELLSPKPLFFILNGYASGYSATAYANNVQQLKQKYGGEVESGELLIEESGYASAWVRENYDKQDKLSKGDALNKKEPRYLPCGIVARWKNQA